MSDEPDDAALKARFLAGGALSSAARRIEKAKADLVFGPLADMKMVIDQIVRAEHDLLCAKATLVTATDGLDVSAVMYGAKLVEGANEPSV